MEENKNDISSDWYKTKVDRKELKKLYKRSDLAGFKHIFIFFSFLILLGTLCINSYGSWWFILFYLCYCTLWGGADAIWHECGHGTAFKTRIYNDVFYQIASFMNNFEPVRWRWSHSLHHSYTASIDPHDFEVEGSIFWAPKNLFNFFIVFVPGISLIFFHKSLHKEIIWHALGLETRVMKECIPDDKKKDCINSSRLFVALWLVIIFCSIILNSLLPILLFLLPKCFASLNMVWGLTQHMGLKEGIKDHRFSTRSIRLNPIFSFIYWKMEYHIEHHMFPTVPSYNLPKLHNLIKDQMPPARKGLWGAYKEILPALMKQAKDPEYKIPLVIPT